jgi:hypothetical protein
MTRDAKQIVKRFASAIAAASMFTPEDMRQAAAHIRSLEFSADDNDAERSAINTFAHFLEKRAEERERSYRAAFGKESA